MMIFEPEIEKRSVTIVLALGAAGLLAVGGVIAPGEARAFGVSMTDGSGYANRWDMAPHFVGADGGNRSISDGLSWNVGSTDFGANVSGFQAFLDALSFAPSEGTVTVGDIEQVFSEAFAAWTVVDSGSGLGAAFTFGFDDSSGLDPFSGFAGAEIDIVAVPLGTDVYGRTESGFTTVSTLGTGGAGITLTSGTTVDGGQAIIGADIWINSLGAIWTLDKLRLVLIHEIGLALGLIDADIGAAVNGTFWDDNYDPSDPLGTLTNSWAGSIDPYNPEGTAGIRQYFVADVPPGSAVNPANPGIDAPGVNIVMETDLSPALLGDLTPLSADDYAGRQFLYPVVPEPSVAGLLGCGILLVSRRRRRRHA